MIARSRAGSFMKNLHHLCGIPLHANCAEHFVLRSSV
jgi:hypothetical protein